MKNKYTRKTNRKTRRRKYSKKMKGGFFKTRDDLTMYQCITNMIKSNGAKLTMISFSSLSGFIFKLNVTHNEDNIYFRDFESKKPVYTIILKIAIISDTPIYSTYTNIYRNVFQKKTETRDDFTKEYDTQNNIYLKTLEMNRVNICPSVMGLLFLNNNEKNQFFLNVAPICGKIGEECVNMLTFLYNNSLNKDNKIGEIGIILMEFVDEKKYMLLSNISNPVIKKYNILYTLAEMVVLFIHLKLINFDSHGFNIFGNIEMNRQSFMIDFGRILDFKKNNENNYNPEFKKFLNFYNKLYDKDMNNTPFPQINNVVTYETNSQTLPTVIYTDNLNVVENNNVINIFFQRDFDEIKDIEAKYFYNVNEKNKIEVKLMLEKIIRFISYVDYAKSCSISNKIKKYPQIGMLLNGLYNNNMGPWYNYDIPYGLNDAARKKYIAENNLDSIDQFDRNRFNILNFDWVMSESNFEFICSKIKQITEPVKSPIFKNVTRNVTKEETPLSPIHKMAPLNTPEYKKNKTRIKRSSSDPNMQDRDADAQAPFLKRSVSETRDFNIYE